MKFAYKFNNLLGNVYKTGNLLFTPDGHSLISPVGNKINIFDLKNNKSRTLSFENDFNYVKIALSPNGCVLITVNSVHGAEMISLVSQVVVHKYIFPGPVQCMQFSPDGKYLAAGVAEKVSIFKIPNEITGQYGTFSELHSFQTTLNRVSCLDWSADSKLLLVGYKDSYIRIFANESLDNFKPVLLCGHNDNLIGVFFEEASLHINTITRSGQLFLWEANIDMKELTCAKNEENTANSSKRSKNVYEDDFADIVAIEKCTKDNAKDDINFISIADINELENRDEQGKKIEGKTENILKYRTLSQHTLKSVTEKRKSLITSTCYHKKLKLLITGYSDGAFYLHELPEVNLIHSLNISDFGINTICFNPKGDWIALGLKSKGQLLVWEWQSEQYIMKQQGHSSEMSCLAYSPDGQYIVTGGEDGKVKLWNVTSGFCFVTFTEHTSSITSVQFSNNKKFLISASLDGTVRAYDITRYRNFRTFTTPSPVQFSSVALDYSGEFVAAGGQDIFEIYLWSMKFGRLLEILSGHEGPVVALAFAPTATSSTLVSGSWDKTIKIWNNIETNSVHETIHMYSDVLAVAFKPNGEEISVSTLNGSISVFDVKTSQQLKLIEGKNDLGSGILANDIISAKKNKKGKAFKTITYSADGECIIGGGNSKYVCIYNIKEGILLKKFQITKNRDLDGIDEFIHHRKMSEFGNKQLIESREYGHLNDYQIRLPGVKKGDMSSRTFKPEVTVYGVKFSPTGLSWASATTEGLLIYSLDKGFVFDPYKLSMEITPKSTRKSIEEKNYAEALIMSLKLNEVNLIQEIIEKIPAKEIDLVVYSLPDDFAQKTLSFVGKILASNQHIEFYLKWSCALLTQHGPKENLFQHYELLTLQQSLCTKYEMLSKICDFNKYTIKALKNVAALKYGVPSKKKGLGNGDQNGISTDDEEEVDNENETNVDDEMILIRSKDNHNSMDITSSDENSNDDEEINDVV